MSNIPLFDSDSESSPRSTPHSFPSADENDDPMYDFYRPRRNAIPVLSRVNAIDGSNNSIRTASTISNDSIKPRPSLPPDPDSGSDSDRESFMFDSDMDGGKLRRSRRRRTHRRKTHRRHRRKTHRRHRRKTHRRRRSHRRH